MFDYAARRRRLSEELRADGVDLLFLGLSSDLEYLSGIERGIPFFGQIAYPHGWVAGGFFRPDADPVFVLPRMVVVFGRSSTGCAGSRRRTSSTRWLAPAAPSSRQWPPRRRSSRPA